jgi:hypothetical protein
MKRKTSILRLLGVIVFIALPAWLYGQSANVALPYLNMSNDAQAGPGGAYFGTRPTPTSGMHFSANLTQLLIDQNGNETPLSEIAINNRNFEGGSLTNVAYTFSGPYDHGSGNAFTFYSQLYNGGSPVTAFNMHNDANSWIVGAGVAQPINQSGSLSFGFNVNVLRTSMLPSLVKNPNDGNNYEYGYGDYLAFALSLAYDGREPDKSFYPTFGLGINNLGFELSNNGGYQKAFLPTDIGAGFAMTQVFPDHSQLSWPLDLHVSLAPAMPYSQQEIANYQKISYGVFAPSKFISLSTGFEYKFFTAKGNYINLKAGVKTDGPNFDKRYTGLVPGCDIQIGKFTVSASYFWTSSDGLYGKTALVGLSYWFNKNKIE